MSKNYFKKSESEATPFFSKKVIISITIAIFFVITVLNSFTIIATGETGVCVRFGQVSDEALTPGVHIKIPFVDKIKKVNNKQIEMSFDGRVWAESSEQTPVYYENIVLSYQITPAASVDLYKTVDKNIINKNNSLITSTLVSSAIKNASITLPTKQVTNRGYIEPLAAKELQASLDEKYGEGAVVIIKLSISNADFEAEYNAVIAERQSAQIKQEQQEIENRTAIAKAEADAEAARLKAQGDADAQKIKTEAEAEMTKIKAQADAEAIKIEAEAQAQANKKILESLEDKIIIKNYIEKWNGELPLVTGDNGNMIIDINSLVE